MCANDAKKLNSVSKTVEQPVVIDLHGLSSERNGQAKLETDDHARQMTNPSEQVTSSIRKFNASQASPKDSKQKSLPDCQTHEVGLPNPSPISGRVVPGSELQLRVIVRTNSIEKLTPMLRQKNLFSKNTQKAKKNLHAKATSDKTAKVKRITKLSTTVGSHKRLSIKDPASKKFSGLKEPALRKNMPLIDHSELHPPSGEESFVNFYASRSKHLDKTDKTSAKTNKADVRSDSVKCLAKFKASLREHIESLKRNGGQEQVINTFEQISRKVEGSEANFDKVYQRFNFDDSDRLPVPKQIKLWEPDPLMSWIIQATIHNKQERKRALLKDALQGSDPYTATLMNLTFECLEPKINISKF